LDEHSTSIQSSKQTRKRNYNDKIFIYDDSAPEDLPDWAYASEEEEKGKAKKSKRRRLTDYEGSIMYSEGEEHQTGESARIGEIRGAIAKEKGKGKSARIAKEKGKGKSARIAKEKGKEKGKGKRIEEYTEEEGEESGESGESGETEE
jgi:hypothetical protein